MTKLLVANESGSKESKFERRRRYRENYKRKHGHPYRWPGLTKAYTKRVNKEQRLQLRKDVISAYGGECHCCGESNDGFLTIDHIKGGGRKHREQLGSSSNDVVYRWLRKKGYPKGFRVLCFNCNCGRAKNGGVCPHRNSS